MEFDKRFKVYNWKSWVNLHWIINPGVAFNELIWGHRIPKIRLEDETVDKPRIERSYVPCPHCKTIHDSRTWSRKNGTAFKNWFGLYCPNCGQVIPCLMNATSFLILALTFPIWGWFRKHLKLNWIERQPDRFKNLNLEYIPSGFKNYSWIKHGLQWGLFMFVIMTFLFPLLMGDTITWTNIIIGIPIWAIAGLGFGYFMKVYLSKTGNKNITSNTQS